MTRLAGAHAVITGGSSGIGLATARLLADRGASVTLIARGSERLASAADELRERGAQVRTFSVDVADPDAVARVMQEATAQGGPCDVLVASAGQARPGRFLELDDEVFRRMIEVDYFGVLYAVRAVAPGMVSRGTGSIVAMSSAAGLIGVYGYTAYGPAKFAVRGLMEALRFELRPHGVHVACVYPADVDTPQLAEENKYKPAETAAVSGTIKTVTADRVAVSIVRAIEREQFAVYSDRMTALLAGVGPLIAPLLRRQLDRKIRRARNRS